MDLSQQMFIAIKPVEYFWKDFTFQTKNQGKWKI